MKSYLLAIDICKNSFFKSKKNYDNCINYINTEKCNYDKVIAVETEKFRKYEIEPAFEYDEVWYKDYYDLKDYSVFNEGDEVTLIGFELDGSLLKISFDLDKLGVKFRVLTAYSGAESHLTSIAVKQIYQKHFGNVLV